MTQRRDRRAGFTLLEMIAVIWALTILLGFGMALILAAVRTNQVGAGTLRELSRRSELADQFRADVARADATPDKLGNWTAGPDCLILHVPDDSHIVYRWHNDQVERIVRTGKADVRRPIAVGPENTTVEFIRPGGARPVVVLRIAESPRPGVTWRVDVAAALVGDFR
jgi:type II secretory pathway pseudopilin PulG